MKTMIYVPTLRHHRGDSYDLGYTFDLDEARWLVESDRNSLTKNELARCDHVILGWEIEVQDRETAKDAYIRWSDEVMEEQCYLPDPDFSE